MSRNVSNSEDILDSRDIIARIEQLQALREPGAVPDGVLEPEDYEVNQDELFHELDALEALAEEAGGASDWQYGETLIRDSYFEQYAEQLADDLGAIDSSAKWPLNHIDWKAAADDLKQDYTEVDYDGVTYWIRF